MPPSLSFWRGGASAAPTDLPCAHPALPSERLKPLRSIRLGKRRTGETHVPPRGRPDNDKRLTGRMPVTTNDMAYDKRQTACGWGHPHHGRRAARATGGAATLSSPSPARAASFAAQGEGAGRRGRRTCKEPAGKERALCHALMRSEQTCGLVGTLAARYVIRATSAPVTGRSPGCRSRCFSYSSSCSTGTGTSSGFCFVSAMMTAPMAPITAVITITNSMKSPQSVREMC